MTIAKNVVVRIWRIDNADDNAVGGAVVTGSVYGNYYGYAGRLEEVPAQQLLLQQGLEVDKTFRLLLWPGNLPIQERWEIEVIKPEDHIYYGERFRIRGVTFSSLTVRDPRQYMMLTLSRSIYAHARQ